MRSTASTSLISLDDPFSWRVAAPVIKTNGPEIVNPDILLVSNRNFRHLSQKYLSAENSWLSDMNLVDAHSKMFGSPCLLIWKVLIFHESIFGDSLSLWWMLAIQAWW